jgi:hypothetical protein
MMRGPCGSGGVIAIIDQRAWYTAFCLFRRTCTVRERELDRIKDLIKFRQQVENI